MKWREASETKPDRLRQEDEIGIPVRSINTSTEQWACGGMEMPGGKGIWQGMKSEKMKSQNRGKYIPKQEGMNRKKRFQRSGEGR